MEGNRREGGFTLIELMSAVAIVSTLALIAIPVFAGLVDRAYRAAVTADLRNAAVTLSEYQADVGRYPIAGEVTLVTSDGVTVTVANPIDLADTTWFCLEGAHARVAGGVIATYDTRVGGLTSNASC